MTADAFRLDQESDRSVPRCEVITLKEQLFERWEDVRRKVSQTILQKTGVIN